VHRPFFVLCVVACATHLAHAATGNATLHWTAPGDDGTSGRAVAYDLRRSNSPMTATNFANATPIPGVAAPKAAGSVESFTVSGLTTGVGYYFALRTVDEAQNWSAVSNSWFYAIPTAAVGAAPTALWLSPPSPNPSRNSVRWSFTQPEPGPLRIEAFEISGRRVRDIAHAWRDAGSGSVGWDLRDERGRSVAPGVYLIRAALGGEVTTTRLVVAR
jgi:hypothetical protein